MKRSCPVCGNEDMNEITFELQTQLTLGDEFTVKGPARQCPNCEHVEEDIQSSEPFREAVLAATQQSVNNMIDHLRAEGLKMSYIERAFELPSKTLNRWKSGGESSATSLAFLRTLVTYPFVVEVAMKRFDQAFAQQVLLREGMRIAYRSVVDNGGTVTFTLEDQQEHLSFKRMMPSTTSSPNIQQRTTLIG